MAGRTPTAKPVPGVGDQSLAWIAAIVLVFGPLAVRQYGKVA